jgi:hypothetical protein
MCPLPFARCLKVLSVGEAGAGADSIRTGSTGAATKAAQQNCGAATPSFASFLKTVILHT